MSDPQRRNVYECLPFRVHDMGKRTLISDPERGIGITFEKRPAHGLWIVGLCFTNLRDRKKFADIVVMELGCN